MRHSKETKEKAIQLYNSKKTLKEISLELNVSKGTIDKWLKGKRNRVSPMPKATKEMKEEAAKLYKSGMNCPEIGKHFGGYKAGTIQEWLHGLNIELRHRGPKSKIKNEDFFDVIDTEAKAYYLGWLMADGNTSVYNGQYSIKVGMSPDDREILDGFMEAIQSTNKTLIKDNITKGKKHKCLYVSLTSRHMCESLFKLGVVPAKIGHESFPDINESMKPHFLRGFFDGDGMASCKNNRKRTGFISSTEMLLAIQDVLGIEQKILHPPHVKMENVNYFHIGKKKSKILYNYIYKDATIWLKRKREVFDEIVGNTEITGQSKD